MSRYVQRLASLSFFLALNPQNLKAGPKLTFIKVSTSQNWMKCHVFIVYTITHMHMYIDYLAWKSFCIWQWRFLAVNWEFETKLRINTYMNRKLEHVECVPDSRPDFAKQKQNTWAHSDYIFTAECIHIMITWVLIIELKEEWKKKNWALAASYFRNVALNYNAPTSCSMFGTDCFILHMCLVFESKASAHLFCTYI